ncbi:MAG TPA: hypothetical protein VJ742_06005, partial [Nitrososphaera sp.]|nr:hypothetical protein [Nitrososphaera sp.]
DSLMAMIEHWKKKAFAYLQLARKEPDSGCRKLYESSALAIAYCIQDLEKKFDLKRPAGSALLPPASEAKAQMSTFEELARRLESLQHRAIYEPECSACKDKKMIAGDPEHPERGLKRCEACKPSPTPETCLICGNPFAVGHYSSDCLTQLKDENVQLVTSYIRLRTVAFEYLEAESKYQAAHLKSEAGIGVSLKASQAHMKLRGVLADSVDFAAGLQPIANTETLTSAESTECQKCGKTGGKVLSYQDGGCLHSRWCCPFCLSVAETKSSQAQAQVETAYRIILTWIIEQCEKSDLAELKYIKSQIEGQRVWNQQSTNSLLPIDMILPCPNCGKLHVDAPEPENGWDNPSHKSHLCHGCGTIFRPADVPTNGVAAIKTRGDADTWG